MPQAVAIIADGHVVAASWDADLVVRVRAMLAGRLAEEDVSPMWIPRDAREARNETGLPRQREAQD